MGVLRENQVLLPGSNAPTTVVVGRISTARALDREDREVYQFVLVAEDSSDFPLTATVPLQITLVDVNDNTPTFMQPLWSFSIEENMEDVLIMEFNVKEQQLTSCSWSSSFCTGH